MSPQEYWWHHGSMLLSVSVPKSTHYSWPLMSAYKCSLGLVSAQVLNSKINNITPPNYANISVNISPHKKLMFSKSMRKELLKMFKMEFLDPY